MRRFTKTTALTLAFVTFISSMPIYAVAEEQEADYMFGSVDTAYATDIEYVDDLELYVTGGKGFYTSPDGSVWTERANGIGMEVLKKETYGFAYGGIENNKSFLVLPDTTVSNYAYLMNQTLSDMTTVYTYTTDHIDLRLKGTVEWDNYTKKFWCGAALADGTQAGLYYSDGTYIWDEAAQQNQMLWTKADTGASALITEVAIYPKNTMTTIISNITSDDKGHLVAVGVWTDKTSGGDVYSTFRNGSGGLTCKTALLVNATDENVQTQLCNFDAYSAASGLSTAVIDKKSNVIIQDTVTYKLLTYYSGKFNDLWNLGNNGKATTYSSSNKTGIMKAIKYAIDPMPNSKSNCIHSSNMTNALSEIVCFDDKVLLIPRAGQGVGGNNYLSDIFVVTYDGSGNLKNRFLPFINNVETAKAIMGDLVNDKAPKYIADVAAGPKGKAVLITGKHKKNIATEQNFATTIAIMNTVNTVSDSTLNDEVTALIDRTENITMITSPIVVEETDQIVVPSKDPEVTPEVTPVVTPGDTAPKLRPTGKNTQAYADWLENYQSDKLVKTILKNNIAFVHDCNRVWVEDKVVEYDELTTPNAKYIEDDQIFMLPVSVINQLFDLAETGTDGMISSNDVKTLTGKYVFIDPRGFIMFSNEKVIDDAVPEVSGWNAYRDYYTVADAMGYISWEDKNITEEERLSYIKKWRGALSIPESADREANSAYLNGAINNAKIEIAKIKVNRNSGICTVESFDGIDLDKSLITSDLTEYKTRLHNAYKRLQIIAIGYACLEDSTSEEAIEMREVILAGIRYLLDYYSEEWDCKTDSKQNWTLTQFSLPITSSNVLCLMYDDLEATEEGRQLRTETCLQIFDKAPIPNLRTAGSQKESETYTNRLWRCYSYFQAAMISGDQYRMNYAMKYSTAAYLYSPHNTGFEGLQFNKDGFYKDGSMIFHSNIPYNMGYGLSYSVLIYELMELTKDTTFDIRYIYGFDNVYDFCLKNMLPFISNGIMTKMTVGRGNVLADTSILRNIAYIASNALDAGKREEITLRIKESLNGRTFTAGSLQYYINNAMLDTIYNNFKSYADSLDTDISSTNESTVYYNQDQVIHESENFTAALSMSSNRIAKYESFKTNNPRGWYLGDGMLYVYTDSKQYTDTYFENVNGYYMPGTTVDSTIREPIHTETEPNWGLPENTWAGGVTDGENTVAGYQLGNQYVSKLAGKKSYFMFGDKIICLGSGITGGSGNVYTILENRIIDKAADITLTDYKHSIKGIIVSEPSREATIHQVVDGDLSTSCSLMYVNDEIVFDFGLKVDIGLVGMAFTYGNIRNEFAKIQISDDGVNYTNVTDFTSSGDSTGIVLYDMNCSGRYYKIISQGYKYHTGGVGTRFSLAEIVFYKEGVTAEQIETSGNIITTGYDDLVVDGTVQTPVFNNSDLLENPEWVWLENQVGFVFLDNSKLNMMREYNGDGIVFMRMSIEHGENPIDESYAYVQLPKATKEITEAFANGNDIRILENSTRAHVIYDQSSGLIGANIFEEDVTIEGITFHTPCAVIINKTDGKMYISDPTWENDQVRVTLPDTMTIMSGDSISVTGNEMVVETKVRRGSSNQISFSYVNTP